MSAPAPIILNGMEVHARREMVNTTDLWRAAGSPSGRAPSDWLALSSSKEFVACVEASLNAGNSGIRTKKGNGGGTYAHWQIGLAYAKYLSPEFHMQCNAVIRERMEGRRQAVGFVLDEANRNVIGGIVKSCAGVAVRECLDDILPAMVERELLQGGAGVTREFVFVLDLLKQKGVPPKGRRALSQLVCRKLIRFSADRGYPLRTSRETGRYMFQIDAVNAWMKQAGESLIARHIADVKGQGHLFSIVLQADEPQ